MSTEMDANSVMVGSLEVPLGWNKTQQQQEVGSTVPEVEDILKLMRRAEKALDYNKQPRNAEWWQQWKSGKVSTIGAGQPFSTAEVV